MTNIARMQRANRGSHFRAYRLHGANPTLPVPAGQLAFFMPIHGSAELDGEAFGLDDLGAPILPTSTAAYQRGDMGSL